MSILILFFLFWLIPWLKKIIWVIGVLRQTVVREWRFDNLCGSHLQSQVMQHVKDHIWHWLYSMTLLDYWPIKILALAPFSGMNYPLFLYYVNQKVDKNYFHDHFFFHFWSVMNRQWFRNHNSSVHDFVSKLPNILIRLTLLAIERSWIMLVRNDEAHYT